MEEEEMDLTTDDDHSILRLNDSILSYSVCNQNTKEEKKKVDKQKVQKMYTANLRGEKLWMQWKLKKMEIGL